MKRLAVGLLAVAVLGFCVFWWLTIPKTINQNSQSFASIEGDLELGENLFWAGGCASCHAVKGAKGDQKLELGGNHALITPVGTFNVPNISPDSENGIGAWSINDFANAMLFGSSPEGKHYYPAFPYTSYASMAQSDVKHLWTYLQTLPAIQTPNKSHDLSFPYNISRGMGLWKIAFGNGQPVLEVDDQDKVMLRGRYLVEGLGHCGECHSPRTIGGLGGMDTTRWLSGGPAPEGNGKIPNITPHETGLGAWSEGDIIYYLESGFTPDFDSVGGSMSSVQENMAKLPKSDLEAIAKYLKAIPAVASN